LFGLALPAQSASHPAGKGLYDREDVKVSICQASKLRVQLSDDPVNPMCKPQ
jgi:hypothetical protein